jgi:ornithine cyclodeaminase/thiomorpholine-carboxylate dehydrogenase
MPAWRPGSPIGVKLVSLFAGNLGRGLPSHLALIALLDPETGAPLCVMDGTYITGARTAGATMVSVRLLAREDARVATIVGAGVQAREHLRLLPLVREVERIFVASEYPHEAARLAEREPRAEAPTDLEAAVRASDVVCLCTSSSESVIEADWVRPGTHVTSIGYAPPGGELPRALAEKARLFVETASAFEAPPVGCVELAGIDPGRGAELGQVLLGAAAGRISDDEITLYKAMGIAIEDLVAAELAYRTALDRGRGTAVTL